MVVYEITRHRSLTEMRAAEYVKRHRAPAAANALYAQIYNMLEANGLRDRPIAWKLVDQFNKCNVSPPPRGHYRFERFRLDDDASVTLRIYRA